MAEPPSPDQLDDLARRIEAWLDRQRDENPVVAHIERDTTSGERRWFVRVTGEEKDVFSIWFHLRQRSLHYETYLMPAPEENEAQLYENLLRRNRRLTGGGFVIGDEDAVFLAGSMDVRWVDEDQLDRVLGSLYQWTEQFFRPSMRIGFASRFRG